MGEKKGFGVGEAEEWNGFVVEEVKQGVLYLARVARQNSAHHWHIATTTETGRVEEEGEGREKERKIGVREGALLAGNSMS